MIKNIFLLSIVAWAAFDIYGRFVNQGGRGGDPDIEVYGRNTCSNTTRLLAELDRKGVDYTYLIIDDDFNAETIHARMARANISTRSYTLPIVDVNGKILVNPSFRRLEKNYR